MIGFRSDLNTMQRFTPLPDITAYELAVCTEFMLSTMATAIRGWSDPAIIKGKFDEMPSAMRRHFTQERTPE